VNHNPAVHPACSRTPLANDLTHVRVLTAQSFALGLGLRRWKVWSTSISNGSRAGRSRSMRRQRTSLANGASKLWITMVRVLCMPLHHLRHLQGRGICYFTPRQGDYHTNETLVRHGCLGSAPVKVSVSISLRTLELYRETHRVTPRHSMQAEVRKLCKMNRVSIGPFFLFRLTTYLFFSLGTLPSLPHHPIIHRI
jgi:hypothetical protein